jgi:(Z)-2-((N-methylformamido)methylene)-5-hydroxybutyrolactone dehydrogenase
MRIVIMNIVTVQAAATSNYMLFIDGSTVPAQGGATRESIDPATGRAWAVASEADAGDVDRAVAAARRALGGPWGELVPRERGRLLRRLADLIEAEAPRLVELEIHDNGKTIREVTAQYALIPEFFRYFGELADKLDGRVLPAERPGVMTYTLIEPVGVVAAITPWNSPGVQVAFKAAPALAAGNTMVLKPSEHTPIATLELAELFARAGFPPGVINVVTGGGEAGAALSGHRDVDLVVFTGSDATGRKVGAAAGEALAGVILELGGKSPQLVFSDADLEMAVAGVAAGICSASGQTCIAGSRAYVHESIADEFTARTAERFRSLRLGPPGDWDTEIGPLAFREHLDGVDAFCSEALADGAEALAGGRRADRDGFYFEPTVLTGVTQSSRIMRDEVFGPVLGLTTFSDEDEAVALANDSRFGLGAGVWTTDLARAHRLMHRLDAGTVYVNTYRLASYQAPLAGFKDSGVGFENGQESLAHFTRRKSVWIDYSGRAKEMGAT